MNDAAQPPDVLAGLAGIVGASHVVTDPDLIAGHLVEPRGLYQGRALALVRPDSTAQTARVAAFCNDRRVPVVPQGGNTGLVGGQIPDSSGGEIVLSLRRMDRVREVDADANAMIVEAGVTLANAQAAAQRADRLFPLSLASEGTCTIGGNLSTNAGGVAVIAYGNARDLVIGVEVVLADGRVINGLTKLRKDNTGYDLKNLFIGAEGTLGIITAAALKLFPNPRSLATAFVGLADPAQALRLLEIARQFAGAGVTSFELIPRIGIDFVLAHAAGARDPLGARHRWYVLIEISSQLTTGVDETMEAVLQAALERGVIEDASIAASQQQRLAFWLLRELALRGAGQGGRLDQARCQRAGQRGAGVPGAGQRGGGGVRSGRAGGAVRPSRRRQHSFQRFAADRRRPDGVSGAVGGDERSRARRRRAVQRLDLGRTRGRPVETNAIEKNQGPRRSRSDARAEGDARSPRNFESGQGAVNSARANRDWLADVRD